MYEGVATFFKLYVCVEGWGGAVHGALVDVSGLGWDECLKVCLYACMYVLVLVCECEYVR
jgi:hypothetical protein